MDAFAPEQLRHLYGLERNIRSFAAWLSRGLFGFELRLLEEAGGVGKAGRVLVSGAALGRETLGLNGLGAFAVGVEHSWPLIHRWQESPSSVVKDRVLQADVRRLPFRDGVFDRVISFNFLNTLVRPSDRRQIVKEWKRVLRPGGRLVFWDFQRGGNLLRLKRWALLAPRRWRFLASRRFPIPSHPFGPFWGHLTLPPEEKHRPFDRHELMALEIRWAIHTLKEALIGALVALGLVPGFWRWRHPGADINVYRFPARVPAHFFGNGEAAALFREAGFRILSEGYISFGDADDPCTGGHLKVIAEVSRA